MAQRHAQHINAQPEASLVGVYDIDIAKGKSFAQQYKCVAFDSYAELLGKNLDMVNICTPNGTHAALSIEALEQGKNVLVEKPMAIHKTDAEAMLHTALRCEKKLYVVKQNRYNPPVQAVKQLLRTKQLGKIGSVVVNCFWNRNDAYYQSSSWRGTRALDGGTLFTQFSHFIDILYYLFGDVVPQQGIIRNFNHQHTIEFEDTGNFTFWLPNVQAIGSLNYTTAAYRQNMEGSLSIFAENATIKIGGKYLNTIDYQATAGFDLENIPTSLPANNYGYYEGSMSNHHQIIDNVVQTLRGNQHIMTNAYEGLKVVEIIENFYACAKDFSTKN